MDCSPPGSSVLGILQARILEWVAISFSRGSSDPGIEPGAPVLQVDSLPSEPLGKPPGKEDSVSSVHLNFLGNSFKIYKINISVSLPVQYCVDPCRVPWSHQLCAQLSCLAADQGSASWPAQVTTAFLCVHLWLLRLPFPMGSLLEASRTLF